MNGLHDRHAELVVLAGIMHEPDETIAGLRRLRFWRSAFYYAHHQEAYDLLMYVRNGPPAEGILVDTYNEFLLRYPGTLAKSFAVLLVDIWEANDFPEFKRWSDDQYSEMGLHSRAALAAAAKVKHLEARRHAHYAAQELLRDTLDPTGDAEYLEGRIDKLDEL